MNRQPSNALFFILLLVILVPVEGFCAVLAYETLGEVTSGLYTIGIILLNGILLMLAFRRRTAATIGVLLVALLIIP